MELKVIKSDKNELRIEFQEIDHGLLNLIKSGLWQDKATELAGFHLDHPEVGKPLFILKTKSKEAKKVWNDTIDSLSEEFSELKKELKQVK